MHKANFFIKLFQSFYISDFTNRGTVDTDSHLKNKTAVKGEAVNEEIEETRTTEKKLNLRRRTKKKAK